jgi:IS30 family transposase
VPGNGRCARSPVAWRHAELRWRIAQKLALQWSPKQIAGWLKQQFPADPGMQVSHETIYRSLFIQTRGVLKKELMTHLRTARQMRQAKGGTTKSGLGQIVDAVSIRERPAEAEDRAVPGHWKETFSREQTTRTSQPWSSAIRAL